MAQKRLMDAFSARDEAKRINDIYDKEGDSSTQKHLNIMVMSDSKLGDFDEYSFYAEFQKKRRQLAVGNIEQMTENADDEDKTALDKLREKVVKALKRKKKDEDEDEGISFKQFKT